MRRLSNFGNDIKLDIGCGKFKREGYIGMDWTDFDQEIVWDINHGIPLPNDSVATLYTSHFVEHLRVHEIKNFIEEMMRVCKKGATVEIVCPDASEKESYFICHYSLWDEARIRGICSEFHDRIVINEIKREGINLIANLTINK